MQTVETWSGLEVRSAVRTSCQRIMACSTLSSCFCTPGRAKALDQDQLASCQHAAHGAESAEPLWPRGHQHTLSVQHARTPYPNPTRSPGAGPPARPSMRALPLQS
eukprot:6960434-Prymnesium_polylepis.1